ncbi:MAG: sulfotransferase [Verrucomicrobiota bacterium]
MGNANCGSTLLTTLLGRHSQIATVGELKMTAVPADPNYLCGCGEKLVDCAFWKEVRSIIRRQGGDLRFEDFATHYRSGKELASKLAGTPVRGPFFELLRSAAFRCLPSASGHLRRVTQRNLEIMAAVCATEGKSAFLDGSKDPARLLNFVRSGMFDLRAIHLVRDGRAIVASYRKRQAHIGDCLYGWKTKALECENLKRRIGPRSILTVRYEDLCSDPEAALRSIFQFADIEDESLRCLTLAEGGSVHIIGHASRLSNAKEIRLREEWRELLTPAELESFGMIEDDLNSRYHYPTTPLIPVHSRKREASIS